MALLLPLLNILWCSLWLIIQTGSSQVTVSVRASVGPGEGPLSQTPLPETLRSQAEFPCAGDASKALCE